MRSFSAPVMCPVFIGRAPERDALYRLIDRTRSGQGRVALVSGEAGIGKSRLVAEAKAYAAAQDFLLLQGSCFQMDRSYPYAPLLDLLRASAAPTPDAPDPIVLEFARLLPELALSHAYEASRTATEIEHQQWMVATSYALGHIYLLLLAPAPAITALEAWLSLAQELGSTYWIATLAAQQGRAYILKHDLPAAHATLQAVMPREQHPGTMAERQITWPWGNSCWHRESLAWRYRLQSNC